MSFINERKLDFWLAHNLNVLFVGRHGVGKTALVKAAFDRAGLKWLYYSCATMDPWVDLVGVPKERSDGDGEPYLDLVRPKVFRDDEVEALFFDEFNRCLTGDTLIQLADGHAVPIKELVGRDHFYVYSLDVKNNYVSIGRGHSARCTGKKHPVLKVTLDNGMAIRCTGNHPFLLRTGQYVRADELRPNDALMCLYKRYIGSGYEQVCATRQLRWVPTYHLADDYNIRNGVYSAGLGNQRHHRDFDKHNNSPENVTRMDRVEHLATHAACEECTRKAGKLAHIRHPDLVGRTIGSPIGRAIGMARSIQTRRTSPEFRKKRSTASKAMYDETLRAHRSAITREQWQSGQFSTVDRLDSNRTGRKHYSFSRIKDNIGDLPQTDDTYRLIYEKLRHAGRGKGIFTPSKVIQLWGSIENFWHEFNTWQDTDRNHRVVSIAPDGYEDVYDITVDEYHNFALGCGVFVHNSHKKVRNAVMELIQFKSINGRRFKNLRVVWAAINPKTEEDNYDVEEVDAAQLDRFQIHVPVPHKCNLPYFISKYGENTARAAVAWWDNLADKERNTCSPRRLDYALQLHRDGGDMRDVIPRKCNVSKLLSELKTGPILDKLDDLFTGNNPQAVAVFLAVENNYSSCIDAICQNREYCEFFLPLIPPEKLAALVADRKPILEFVVERLEKHPPFAAIIEQIVTSSPAKAIVKQIREMIKKAPATVFNNQLRERLFGNEKSGQRPYFNPRSSFKDGVDWKDAIERMSAWQCDTTNQRRLIYDTLVQRIPQVMELDTALACLKLINDSLVKRSHADTLRSLGQLMGMINHCLHEVKRWTKKDWLAIRADYESDCFRDLAEKIRDTDLEGQLCFLI